MNTAIDSAGIGVVVDDENALAALARQPAALARPTLRHDLADARQPHADLGPEPWPLADHVDLPLMQLHEAPNDGEPDAQPALAAIEPAVTLREHLEDVRQELRLDADSVVAHANADAAAVGRDVQLDVAAVGRVLGGVVQHVAEDLAQAREVAEHPDRRVGHVDRQRVALRIDERPHDLERCAR